jgi:hypothetical protein
VSVDRGEHVATQCAGSVKMSLPIAEAVRR